MKTNRQISNAYNLNKEMMIVIRWSRSVMTITIVPKKMKKKMIRVIHDVYEFYTLFE